LQITLSANNLYYSKVIIKVFNIDFSRAAFPHEVKKMLYFNIHFPQCHWEGWILLITSFFIQDYLAIYSHNFLLVAFMDSLHSFILLLSEECSCHSVNLCFLLTALPALPGVTWLTVCLSPFSVSINEYYLKNRVLFLTVLETEMFKNMVPASAQILVSVFLLRYDMAGSITCQDTAS
jgi:hypothetical protein